MSDVNEPGKILIYDGFGNITWTAGDMHMQNFKWCDTHHCLYGGSCESCEIQLSIDLAELHGRKHRSQVKCECGAHKVKDSRHTEMCPLWEKL